MALTLTRAASLRRLPRAPNLEPYAYLLPALAGVGLFVYWPLVNTLQLSFLQWNLLPNIPQRPVGMANYASVLTLPEMGRAVVNTLIYIVGLLPFSVVLPLAIAILISDIGGRWRSAYRAILFLPVLVAPIVVGVVWRWLLHPTAGVLNLGLSGLFGGEPIAFFRDPSLAIWAIVGITAWELLGFSVLIFSAGLTGINREYVEAAQLDGASAWQVAWRVTLPLLSPTVLFMVLLTVIHSAQWTFPLINVLTSGGPQNATTNVYYLLWEFGFHNFNVGFSSAAAVLFFLAFGVVAWIFSWLTDRYSFYEG